MKKFTFMAAIAVVLTVFNGCQKDVAVQKNGLPDLVSSKYKPEFGKFKEEIIVYDSSGENSLFIALHANEEEYIKDYQKNFKLELVSSPNVNNALLKSGTLQEKKEIGDTTEIPKLAIERKVTVEFLAYNLKDKNHNFSLSITRIKTNNENKLKSADFKFGAFTEFVTEEDWLGVVHQGYGWDGNNYDLRTYFLYKECWLCGWSSVVTRIIGDDREQYYEYIEDFAGHIYKLKVQIYFDSRETDETCLLITTDWNAFRGHDCSVGSYDSRNCFVGTAPSGTTAFIYAGHFYYTPINGNQCPLPGSSFDSVNCFVGDYPSNCIPFILENSWYVRPDLIDYFNSHFI